eukprot:EG_transcript_11679
MKCSVDVSGLLLKQPQPTEKLNFFRRQQLDATSPFWDISTSMSQASATSDFQNLQLLPTIWSKSAQICQICLHHNLKCLLSMNHSLILDLHALANHEYLEFSECHFSLKSFEIPDLSFKIRNF